MAETLPRTIQRLIKVLAKLPGVGSRTAMRYALHLVRAGEESLLEVATAVTEVAQCVQLCDRCFALTENSNVCGICNDPIRADGRICIVEGFGDVIALEATGLFGGRYFVLHKLLSPLKGIGPEELRIDRLMARVRAEQISEVVLATPLTTDGETTATYLSRVLTQGGARVTRLASGVPVGGSIEYLDHMTLTRAFQDRKDF
jgi:recombination protein RecR